MENNELSRNEVRAFLFRLLNDMSDEEMRQLLKELEERQNEK